MSEGRVEREKEEEGRGEGEEREDQADPRRCCACPETKSARDECFLRTAPEEADVKCGELLEAHKTCMRGFGFKV